MRTRLTQDLPSPPRERRSAPRSVPAHERALEQIPEGLFRTAARHVLDQCEKSLPEGATVDEVRRRLIALGQALSAYVDGQRFEIDPALSGNLSTELLEELRIEVLSQWMASSAGSPPPRSKIEAMCWAFEQCSVAVAADPDDQFISELSSPKGLELVVEVAHDLRSPLTSILFLAETLQRGQSGPVVDLQHRQLGLIYSAALGLSTLASNVIELARGGSRLSDDEPAPFSVADVFDSVRDIIHPMAEEKGLALRMLPPTTDHRLGPAQALGRVLLNLTTNAIKFTEEGFVEIVAKATDITKIEFSVRDSGDGINPEALDTLYLPFRPAPGGDHLAFSGTGLGLALCRRLVRAMGSELQFETRPGWGTRFFFELDLPPAGHL